MDFYPYLFCLFFYLLYFVLPPFEDNGLPFWVPDVLCQHSEVVLWNWLSIQMFFWWICGGESGLPVLFLCHLRTAPPRWTFVGKVMSLLFNMMSRLVVAFLPRSKRLLISWLQSLSAVILEPLKIKSLTVSIVSPSICHEVMEPDAMILVFWMFSFKPTFSLSSFTFIKWLFSSSLLSSIRVVLSAYLRLLISLPAIYIPACASSSPVFLMTYPAYELNKQGDHIQSWHTPFLFGTSLLFHVQF